MNNSNNNKTLLEAKNISVNYGERNVIDEANFYIKQNEIFALVGSNGSGKTTLMKAITAQVNYSGSIQMNNKNIDYYRKKGKIAYVPQVNQHRTNFPLRVLDVILQGSYKRLNTIRRPNQKIIEEVQKLTELLGVDNKLNSSIDSLSGGQLKRVLISRALMQDAEILILDEPFNGIDTYSLNKIIHMLKEVSKNGCSVFLSTHDIKILEDLADRVMLWHKKPILIDSPVNALSTENIINIYMKKTDNE